MAEYRAGSHAERIVKVAYDAERRDAGKSCGYQHLCAVGNDALNEAGECIEYACRFPAVQVEDACYVLGDGAGGDDGNGVVGGTKIGYAHQCGYAQFRSPLAVAVTWRGGR